MNKENAHLYLPLVQALVDGKTIQMRDVVSEKVTLWDDLDPSDIHFCQHPDHYRIKPEPRTFEMWLTPTGTMYPILGLEHPLYERITVQEVLE